MIMKALTMMKSLLLMRHFQFQHTKKTGARVLNVGIDWNMKVVV